ncbi:arginase family protein [Actinomadura violacea]|uniref:arginase family protein n=1 Tax=Actinomadura violacea TaxID=2819934 RepID=UPI0027DDC24E|nr:arginase family protein [Actinomadura violacea]
MTIALISAPTNLGLRPPAPTSVPGTAKAPEALREAGLHRRFLERGGQDRGAVVPGRYADDAGPGVLRNQAAIVEHARRLAERIDAVRADGLAPLVIGGDCSLLVGAGVALRRAPGRHGLVHLDGHTDFRHPGNSDRCASLAGEDLAAVVGLHWPAVADIDGLGPYFAPADTAHAGCRDDDTALEETTALLGAVVPAARIREQGVREAARRILDVVDRDGLDGHWLHLDVDILDPGVMPAVDSPDPGGLTADELTELLAALAPRAIGAQVTVFDPDLDPDGGRARLLTDILVDGLAALGERR